MRCSNLDEYYTETRQCCWVCGNTNQEILTLWIREGEQDGLICQGCWADHLVDLQNAQDEQDEWGDP